MRNNLVILLCLFLFLAEYAVAHESDYAVEKIPAELLKDANAIVRESNTEVEIVSATEIYETQHYVITILNKEGDKYGVVDEIYNKWHAVESIQGKQYDGKGEVIDKIKKSEIEDIGVASEAFFDDSRRKIFKFKHSEYPYTCEYEIVRSSNSSFFFPEWHPQLGRDCAVQKADLVIDYPVNMPFRYRVFHLDSIPILTTENNQKKLVLSVENIHTHNKADGFTPLEGFSDPTLIMAIDNISLLNYEGKMGSWNSFGEFIYNLNVNRDSLPEQTKKYVHQLTDTCTTQFSKVNLLYKFLQQNERYVFIDLGIGGWQTLEAKFVAEKGYGDCKALSNFMKALLKEAGITSYQALVYGNKREERKILIGFPYCIFNHVILCVPGTKGDTTWLECTAKNLPTGYLGSFTSNRNVLLLTPSGGYVVKTPAYNANVNILIRSAQLEIDNQDEVHGMISLNYSGSWWDEENHNVSEGKSVSDKYFNGKFTIPTYAVGGYELTTGCTNNIPFVNEEIPVSGEGMISKTGNRIFVSPRVFNFSIPQTNAETRKDSFEISRDYQVFDTTVIKLEGNYTTEKLAPNIDMDLLFASYHTKTFFDGNILKIVVYYRQKEGIYPPELFADYKKLSKEINSNAAYSKIVLNKKI